MQDNPLYKLASRFRPEIKEREGTPQLLAMTEVLQVLYLAPFALITIIWLLLITHSADLQGKWLPICLLFIGFLITNNQTAILLIEVEPQKNLIATSSLGVILLWVGLLLFGPVMVWFSILADGITNLIDAWRNKQLSQNVFWGPFSTFVQNIVHTLGSLLGLAAYQALGGSFPFTNTSLLGWLPALLAILITAVFSSVILIPSLAQISRLIDMPFTRFMVTNLIVTVGLTILVPAPFAIPVALIFSYSGSVAFVFILLGLVLANLLAHHLSRTNQRSMRQSREMTELEKLGESILESPPDGSSLTDILKKHVISMFSNALDIIEIRIFEDVDLPGFALPNGLHIVQPHQTAMPSASVWEDLKHSDEEYLILEKQIPTGTYGIYGYAIIAKIFRSVSVGEAIKPECIGGIYLLRHKRFARTIDSLPTLQALASQIASALYRAQVHQETLIAEKMSQELEFAGTIQATFLPEAVPSFDGWSLDASLIPARQTSGDFYDFIPLSENRIGLLVGDVADKGTGAALYMALSRTLLRTFAMQYPDAPPEVFRKANDRIFEDSRADQFVTVFYGVLNLVSGQFRYCNAGHNPTFLLHAANGQHPEPLKRTGVALGAMEGLTWKSSSVMLNSGDILIFYTDGVVEAQNENEEFFGEERLLQSAKAELGSDAKVIHHQIMEGLNSFIGKAAQFDDITLLTLKRE